MKGLPFPRNEAERNQLRECPYCHEWKPRHKFIRYCVHGGPSPKHRIPRETEYKMCRACKSARGHKLNHLWDHDPEFRERMARKLLERTPPVSKRKLGKRRAHQKATRRAYVRYGQLVRVGVMERRQPPGTNCKGDYPTPTEDEIRFYERRAKMSGSCSYLLKQAGGGCDDPRPSKCKPLSAEEADARGL